MEERSSEEQKNPGEYTVDPLTEVLRKGSRTLLTQAVKADVMEVLAAHLDIQGAQGQQTRQY